MSDESTPEHPETPPPTSDDVLNVREAAAYLRFSEEYVRELARQGKIPARKIGRRSWRFSRRALLRFVEGDDEA